MHAGHCVRRRSARYQARHMRSTVIMATVLVAMAILIITTALRRFQNAVEYCEKSEEARRDCWKQQPKAECVRPCWRWRTRDELMPRTLAGTKLVRSAGPTVVISHDSSPAEGALQHDGRGTQRNVAAEASAMIRKAVLLRDSTPKMHAENLGRFAKMKVRNAVNNAFQIDITRCPLSCQNQTFECHGMPSWQSL